MSVNDYSNELANRQIENSDSPTKPPAPRRDRLALNAILAVQPVVRINSVDQPQIQLPFVEVVTSASDWSVRPSKFYALSHPRVRAEIADLVQENTGVLLFDQEINRVVNVLEGMAWKSPLLESELEQALDESPLVEAVYLLLMQPESTGQFQSSGTGLLEALQKIGNRKGLDLRSKDWPRSASILSRRLQDLKPTLQKVGIEVTVGRKGGGERYVSLKMTQGEKQSVPCDDGVNLSPQEPPHPNAKRVEQIKHSDDCSDEQKLRMQRLISK